MQVSANQLNHIYQQLQDTQQRNDTKQAGPNGNDPSKGKTSNQTGAASGTNLASSGETARANQETYRAYFAVDEHKNVVIRVEDAGGKLVRQFPPEDFLKAVRVLDNALQKIFDQKA
jgi:uncharacterized FlaG/YvyC family protein